MQMQNSCVCNQKLLFTAVANFAHVAWASGKKLPDKSSYVCNLLDNVDKCTLRQQMATPVDTQLGVLGCTWFPCPPVCLSVCLTSALS